MLIDFLQIFSFDETEIVIMKVQVTVAVDIL